MGSIEMDFHRDSATLNSDWRRQIDRWKTTFRFQEHGMMFVARTDSIPNVTALPSSGRQNNVVYSFIVNLTTSPVTDILTYSVELLVIKVKLSLRQALEAHTIVRRRGSHICRHSAHRWRWGQPYAPAALYPPGRFLVLISVIGWVDPRAIVRLEGLGQLKSPITSSGIELNLPTCSIVLQPTTLLCSPCRIIWWSWIMNCKERRKKLSWPVLM
jgi:hypothetical protein